jgi:hypothetical protein
VAFIFLRPKLLIRPSEHGLSRPGTAPKTERKMLGRVAPRSADRQGQESLPVCQPFLGAPVIVPEADVVENSSSDAKIRVMRKNPDHCFRINLVSLPG